MRQTCVNCKYIAIRKGMYVCNINSNHDHTITAMSGAKVAMNLDYFFFFETSVLSTKYNISSDGRGEANKEPERQMWRTSKQTDRHNPDFRTFVFLSDTYLCCASRRSVLLVRQEILPCK